MRQLLTLTLLSLWSCASYAQPVLRGPLTTNSPAIKTAATGGLIDAQTNNFFRVPVEVNTNLIVTNLSLGQVIRIEVWPTNGFTVTFLQQTASNSMQGWVQPLTSNQWNTVYVSRPDSTVTNFDIRAADYIETAGQAITRTTNFAARTVAAAAIALSSLSTNGTQATAAWTNLNLIYGTGIVARVTNVSGNVSMHLSAERANRVLFTLTNNITVTNTTAVTSFITNALWGSQVIPAGTLTPGVTLRFRAQGHVTSVSATACETGIRFNNGNLIATNQHAFATSLVNDNWALDVYISCRASGASGSVLGVGLMTRQTTSGAASANSGVRVQMGLLQSTVTVDTTIDQVFDAYMDPGATTHGLTVTSAILEIIQ